MDPVSIAIEGAAIATRAAGAVGVGATVAAEAAQIGTATAEVAGEVVKDAITAAEIATVVPNPIAASEVSQLAARATASPDIRAGEQAIRDLVALEPTSAAQAEIQLNAPALGTEQETTVKVQVETSLERWQRENPKPDPKTNPEAYRKWCEQYENAEIEYISNSRTEFTMQGWDKENPEPDNTKNPEQHTEWQRKRSEIQSKVREQTTKETRNMKELEKADVLAKINRLRADYQERMDIVEGIKALNKKPAKTDQDKIDLAKFRIRKSELDSEIVTLEADLKARAGRASPLVTLMITTALASMAIYKIGQQDGVF